MVPAHVTLKEGKGLTKVLLLWLQLINKCSTLEVSLTPALGDQIALWAAESQAVTFPYPGFSINKDLSLFCVPSCQLWKPRSRLTYRKGVQERCLKREGQPGSKCRGQGTWGKGGGLNSQQREASAPCCGFFWHTLLSSWAQSNGDEGWDEFPWWLKRRLFWFAETLNTWLARASWRNSLRARQSASLWYTTFQERLFHRKRDLPTSSAILIGCGEALPSSGLCRSSWEASFLLNRVWGQESMPCH